MRLAVFAVVSAALAIPARADTTKVEPGEVKSSGDYNRGIIRRMVRAKLPAIQACYEAAKQPALAGTVTVTFAINLEGKVHDATASGLPGVDACVAGVIAKIEFTTKPPTEIQVTYPFAFHPAKP